MTTISPGALATAEYVQDIVPPEHDFVIWSHVDSGSNVHIVNNYKFLHRPRRTRFQTLGQVTGTRVRVHSVGEWHVHINGYSVVLHDVVCMPNNPTCTISPSALKRQDGFICASHDSLSKFHVVCPIGIDHVFRPSEDTLRVLNGLDYVSMVTLLPQRPDDASYGNAPNLQENPDDGGYMSANAASIALPRRSSRFRKPTPKMQQYENRIQHPKRVEFSPPISHIIVEKSSSAKSPNGDESLQSPILTVSASPHSKTVKPAPPSLPSHSMLSVLAHLKFGCRNLKNIIHMAHNNSLQHLPRNLKILECPCPICLKCKLPKLPRNPTVSTHHLEPGQMLQMDFAFMNTESIRGFTSYLSCDCVSSKYSYRFCTRRKRAPVDIIRWIIITLRSQGKKVNFIRFDEGRELARSYEINNMLVTEFQVVMQTTGGYASHLNGCTERGHRTDSDGVKTSLYAAGLHDKFWCFALLYNNYINRRWCKYPENITPYEKWCKIKPSFRKLHIFGAAIYVHTESPKKLEHKASVGVFLGYGASTAILYYFDPVKNTIKRAHHARIDNYQVGANASTPGSMLIRKHADLAQISLPDATSALDTIPTPFTHDKLFTYEVTIPASGPLGLNMENDKIFGLPIINTMESNSPFAIGCQKIMQKNSWIVGIHHDEPITVSRFLEYIQFLRSQNILSFQLTLTKRTNPTATDYQMLRNYFDNFRPVSAKATIVLPEAKYACQLPLKPPTPTTWRDVIDGEFKDVWYKAVYERYDKNHKVGLLSVPIPANELPVGATVLRAVSAFKIKNTMQPNIYDFYFRMCADGSKQVKGIHFDESHSPTPSTWTILTSLAISAAFGLVAYTIDVDNAFQNTPRYPTQNTKPVFLTCPPLYLHWFKQRFPHFQFHKNTKYILQCFMNMQGMKTAGRDFHQLLTAVLKQLNIHPTSVDKGIFVFMYKNTLVLLAISTDDILLFTKYEDIYHTIRKQLQAAFGTTTQTGHVINYLNYRIIQSSHAISIDQTDFILSILDLYLPRSTKHPRIDTPLRTDKQFDVEIVNSVPATPSELKQLSVEFKGDFRTIFGQVCHIMKSSRPDLANAVNRLGVFQAAPNRLAFKSIYRVLLYLRTHPNVPLVYPRTPFTKHTTLVVHSNKGQPHDSIKIPHCLCCHVDISFAPHAENRHSVGGHVETLNCVAVDWKTTKQMTCATSATDAETRQYYNAAKRAVRIRNFLRQIGVKLPQASQIFPSFKLNYEMPTPIYEDNKGTRDMLAAGKVTSNLKHVDVPLTYLHSLHESSTIKTAVASSSTMLANFLTKQETGPQHIRSTKWVTGRRFYPPRNTLHYSSLTQTVPLSLF